MKKQTFSLILILLFLTSTFQQGISQFLRHKEKSIYKNIGFISHEENKGKILMGQRKMIDKNEIEESKISKNFEADEKQVVVPKEDVLGSYSLINFSQSKGEIIIPCFGMWWPVGGNDMVYEYTEYDSDGEEVKKKRRRRMKKQKRTSKTIKRRKRT